jgi:glycosyltransferase involved in cell wall biosynthesis
MCTYNNQNTIDRAINSLLVQDFKNWELIVVDANSSDETRNQIIQFSQKDSRISFIPLDYQSPWVESSLITLNYAVGKYFMFLDGDDFVSKNYISCLINEFNDKEITGAAGKVNLIDESGVKILNNPSVNRIFGFTNSAKRWYRVSGAFLMPESLGLVNCLYGLWSKEFLHTIDLWKKDTITINFDQIFVLNALKRGRIKYTDKTIQYRSSFRAKPSEEIKFLSRIRIFINTKELLKTIPPVHSYLTWIIKNISISALFYLLIVLLRTLISCSVYMFIFAFNHAGSIKTIMVSILLKKIARKVK